MQWKSEVKDDLKQQQWILKFIYKNNVYWNDHKFLSNIYIL